MHNHLDKIHPSFHALQRVNGGFGGGGVQLRDDQRSPAATKPNVMSAIPEVVTSLMPDRVEKPMSNPPPREAKIPDIPGRLGDKKRPSRKTATYTAISVPRTSAWVPGAITRAVRTRWIVATPSAIY